MKYGSVCSGIEAATVAWHPLGWKPEFFSEIEPFPNAVLKHRWPKVPNLGDMTKFKEWKHGSIDLLVGGTPCQAFSVAGLRKGLADPRGNLALTFLAILDRARPRWVVWENVPGVLSSWSDAEAGHGGTRWESNDFDTFTAGIRELGYGLAWRVLDAKYFGVPQRRRRIFVVGYLGDWRRAAAVLFESHSLSWNPPPSRAKGQGIAADVAHSLRGRGNASHREDSDTYVPAIIYDMRGNGDGQTSPTLSRSAAGDRPNDFAPCVVGSFKPGQSAKAWSLGYELDQCPTLESAEGGNKPAIHVGMAVRRLTPREAERLQGFEDDYTLIPYRGGQAKDGPRYKSIGNSMAVDVMRWIGQRIEKVERME